MNGIIIINKPKGCTSHDVVHKVKKIFNEKVGHTGTLDPMATGVLPLLVGKGTNCSKYLINHDKIYEVVLQLGERTDTLDSEGQIIEKQEVLEEIVYEDFVKQTLEQFKGKQLQTPPMYSAIKVKGKKLYEYARKGETVEVNPREIEIYNIELLKINEKDLQIEFRVKCSKGTYIRSLCDDIAKKLGTIGYMKELKRIQVGEFNIDNSITIEELEENKDNIKFLEKNIISLESFFKESTFIKGNIDLDNRKLELFLNGVKLTSKNKSGVYVIYCNNKFIGTGIIQNELLKRDIII